jgi:redox-sensitive bicupin YhaK (pirin superfamily)
VDDGLERITVMSSRSSGDVIPSVETYEGEGFLVHRPFPTRRLSQFDPFLLLDEMGPMDLRPEEAKGAPDHPHRGFETVTYLLSGSFQHKDSRGHAGRLNPGDVQWMTAGAGVVHSEMPSEEFRKTGGRLHGLQLWVNLPRARKMTTPRYQEIPGSRIPMAVSEDGRARVRVLAGESMGARAVIDTHTPIFYLDFTLEAGAEVSQPVPQGYNAFAYVLEGAGLFGSHGTRVEEHSMVPFNHDGDHVVLRAVGDTTTPVRALLIGGLPLNEPVARYGPFVMNTKDEIIQAFDDYQSGRMGSIDF